MLEVQGILDIEITGTDDETKQTIIHSRAGDEAHIKRNIAMGAGNDLFEWKRGDFTTGITIDGGAGVDTLEMGASGFTGTINVHLVNFEVLNKEAGGTIQQNRDLSLGDSGIATISNGFYHIWQGNTLSTNTLILTGSGTLAHHGRVRFIGSEAKFTLISGTLDIDEIDASLATFSIEITADYVLTAGTYLTSINSLNRLDMRSDKKFTQSLDITLTGDAITTISDGNYEISSGKTLRTRVLTVAGGTIGGLGRCNTQKHG